jgi:hypothetical protein
MEETMSNVVFEPVLQGILDACMTEKERLVALCNKKAWTTHEFACLMVGIHPQEEKKATGGHFVSDNYGAIQKDKICWENYAQTYLIHQGVFKSPFG